MKVDKMIDSSIPIGAIFSIIHREHLVFAHEEAKYLNITGSQIPCLLMISKKQGITQEELANNKFHIDKGFIARIVRKLEDDEFIYRVHDPKNRRKYHIFLTEKGKNCVHEIKGIEEKWKKIVFEGLEKDEISKLMEVLILLAENSIEKIKNRS